MATSRRIQALITNDDGIDSPGLWALAAGARDAGLDVVVAAPHVDTSGAGASVLSVREANRTRLHPRELPGLPGIPAFAVEGHPAYIVHAAARGWLDPVPDIVLAGINPGANCGHAVLHSGTVGAALTAGLHGWRGLAVSLDCRWPPQDVHWESAAHLLPEVLDILLSAAEGTVLTLNVPDLPVAELGELREARLARFGQVEIAMEQRDGEDGSALHATVRESRKLEPGTDTALLAEGHPTITELQSVAELPGLLDGRKATDRQAG